MDFTSITKINKPSFYLERALSKGRKNIESLSISRKNIFEVQREVEKNRLKEIKKSLSEDLKKIYNCFLYLKNLSPFYSKLVKTYIDLSGTIKNIEKIKISEKVLEKILSQHLRNLRTRKNDIDSLKENTRKYIGRVSSVMKRLEKVLDELESTRKLLRDMPNIDENLFTIVITGFPNVGKSTLLSKLTTAKPEIGVYPFTTKGLNVGWLEVRFHRLQVIDVPGTLVRDKSNLIEQRAEIVLKYLASLIIFILDPTEQYPLKEQKMFLEKVRKERDVPIIVYVSKKDIVEKDVVEKLKKDIKTEFYCEDVEQIKKKIEEKFIELQQFSLLQ